MKAKDLQIFGHILVAIALLVMPVAGQARVGMEADLATGNVEAVKVIGTITSPDGEPLIGVNVTVEGTTNGTATDLDGSFELSNVPEDATLVVSYVGYKTTKVLVEGRSMIDVQLEADAFLLDELVVVGYGVVKKSDLTGAVTRLDATTFESQPMTQLTDMLTGTVAGFNASQGTSASGGSSLEVRGPTSLNASTEPMLVVDGVIYNGSIRDINPADIATIDILKDASSAAVYGARAASGVIIITTKKGLPGKPTVNFGVDYGVAQVAKAFRPNNGAEYPIFRRDVLRSINPSRDSYYFDDPNDLPQGVSIEDWRNSSDNPQADNGQEWLSRLGFYPIEIENYNAGNSVDWYDQVIQSGLRQNYDLSIGGATDNLSYYWSMGYQDNEGVILGDQYSTIRSRLNLDLTVTDWLTVGMNAQYADRDESSVEASLGGMFVNSPYGSIFEDDGRVKWYPNDFPVQNPLIDYYGQDRERKINTLFASLYTKVQLPFGIDYKLSFQPKYQFLRDYNFWSSETIAGGSTRSNGYGTRREFFEYGWIADNLLHWNKAVGNHNFDVTLLYSTEKNETWQSDLSNQSFVPNQNLGYGGIQFGTNPAVSSNDEEITGDAAMARLNYTFMNKYLLTASIRRDGYSAFGIENPRATFPAIALAWKISEEDFFNVDWVDQMKIRASWGINGNRDIGAYSALAQLSSTLFYDGSNVQVGVFNNTLSNHSLVWEKTQSTNFGIDLGLFGNRLNVSAEYYDMNTTDLLMLRLLPEITGYESVVSNLGELTNKGVELSIDAVTMARDNFDWRTSFVFSLNRNKIVRLFGDFEEVVVDGQTVTREVPDYSNEWFPGHAIDEIWNYNIEGIWQLDEADQAASYRLEPGDFKATDTDGNGAYEAIEDKQFIGYEKPRFRLGLRNSVTFLNNFSASIFLRAELGHMAPFVEALRRGGNDTYDRRNTYSLPYWTPENGEKEYASLTTNENVFGGGIMIFKPASFVRIQDLSLTYALPAAMLDRIKFKSMRVFASVRNLYSFDKWPGWDAEAAANRSTRNDPMPRTYTIGANLSL